MLYILCLFAFSHAMPTMAPAEEHFPINPAAFVELPLPTNAKLEDFFHSMDGEFVNIENDGVTSFDMKKKKEKLPMMKAAKIEQQFIAQPKPAFADDSDYDFTKEQPGVVPKMTGKVEEPKADSDMEYFNFGEGAMAASNPAATFLEGGDFEMVAPPKCTMTGCTGPVPNDGSFPLETEGQHGKACHQAFVPLNGCVDNKGYPMGMVCAICCDCTSEFKTEMMKTFGYKNNYRP